MSCTAGLDSSSMFTRAANSGVPSSSHCKFHTPSGKRTRSQVTVSVNWNDRPCPVMSKKILPW